MRKRKDVRIVDGTKETNRDFGKVYVLTEKDAISAWKWGLRAMGAIVRTGVQIPDEIARMGVVGVLVVGFYRLGYIPWPDLEPLVDEMLTCVQIMPTPSVPNVVRPLMPEDIEEPTTLSTLVREVFELHAGFFPKETPSTSPPEGAAASG